MNKTLVAAAGEHYVAYKISSLGYLAALVRQGSPAIDLLASTQDGGRTLGIQVKTTGDAQRWRGRGASKVLFEVQFPLGHNAVEQASDKIMFCFVDLHSSEPGAEYAGITSDSTHFPASQRDCSHGAVQEQLETSDEGFTEDSKTDSDVFQVEF